MLVKEVTGLLSLTVQCVVMWYATWPVTCRFIHILSDKRWPFYLVTFIISKKKPITFLREPFQNLLGNNWLLLPFDQEIWHFHGNHILTHVFQNFKFLAFSFLFPVFFLPSQFKIFSVLTHWLPHHTLRDPPLISGRSLEYFWASESTKINHMRSNNRHKIRFQDFVYLKFNKWTAKY